MFSPPLWSRRLKHAGSSSVLPKGWVEFMSWRSCASALPKASISRGFSQTQGRAVQRAWDGAAAFATQICLPYQTLLSREESMQLFQTVEDFQVFFFLLQIMCRNTDLPDMEYCNPLFCKTPKFYLDSFSSPILICFLCIRDISSRMFCLSFWLSWSCII